MSRLPVLLSVPHAGLQIPREVEQHCVLTPGEVLEDSDVGAADIFFPLQPHVKAVVTTSIARAIVDVDRAEDDRFRNDGVVKTHTRHRARIWRSPPADETTELLLERFHRPYRARLEALAPDVALGLDCHTVASTGPPGGSNPWRTQPIIGLSDGGSCPGEWLEVLAQSLHRSQQTRAIVQDLATGGHIARSRPGGIPWVQLKFARVRQASWTLRRAGLLQALQELCRVFGLKG